ncbi:Uncharacterised protein [Nocardiopsis dassonvillei]|uniref:Uncharacterized protein n=1 Tax=Nocardiopsis dassonvillei (strain ATCC 23218 / DSM 43111 / CIP 107115 / JCM 7437 / KCTC 9190 / NBRC 14626 / NCTC 10488 / NRRL B-5397 / IMRU 509) TaxID=446468 RepID=D7AX80_NOCDD|nr:hypothetical protein Ndas_4461 [Nocardiopsis dassonvillei subsp. dassonvillei DSM 43111]VEI90362.1 Uncharacterised protein [Nocardiopsis dassonvillei]
MWTLRAQPGWKRRELRTPREEREVEQTREAPAERGEER